MKNKKKPNKYNIQFEPTLASNCEAMEILNNMKPGKRAQIIAESLNLYNRTYNILDNLKLENIKNEKSNIKVINTCILSEMKSSANNVENDEDALLEDKYDNKTNISCLYESSKSVRINFKDK